MQAISVKNLRQQFPFVRSELEKGESFLIIHKSKPIGRLEPIQTNKVEQMDDEFRDWERAALQDLAKHTDSDDYLTEEEVKYYMSVSKPL